jgi:hypothetical protein
MRGVDANGKVVCEQSTSGDGQIQVDINTDSVQIPGGATRTLTVSCASNELMTGGGFKSPSDFPNSKFHVLQNGPSALKTWKVAAYNANGYQVNLEVYVFCLQTE